MATYCYPRVIQNFFGSTSVGWINFKHSKKEVFGCKLAKKYLINFWKVMTNDSSPGPICSKGGQCYPLDNSLSSG